MPRVGQTPHEPLDFDHGRGVDTDKRLVDASARAKGISHEFYAQNFEDVMLAWGSREE
jgi:hypothetical protein